MLFANHAQPHHGQHAGTQHSFDFSTAANAHVFEQAQSSCGPPALESHAQPNAGMPFAPSNHSLREGFRNFRDLPGASALIPIVPTENQALAQPHAAIPKSRPHGLVRAPTQEELPEKIAVVQLDAGTTLTATIAQDGDTAEWEWARAVSFMGMKTTKHHLYLSRNMDNFKAELQVAEVVSSAIVYRGRTAGESLSGHHMMLSPAFVLMILLTCANKRFQPAIKSKALTLGCNLLRLAAGVAPATIRIACVMYGDDKGYHHVSLSLQEGCMVYGLAPVFSQSSQSKKLWSTLMENGFSEHKIRSSMEAPTLWDLVLFLLVCKIYQSKSNVWKYLGQFLWPKVIWLCGVLVDKLALEKSNLGVQQLPLVKTSKGRVRKPPWINKLVLLQKMRTMKHHRHMGMRTHSDLVTCSDALVKSENLLATGLYMTKCKEAFQGIFHLTIHWDPASYDCSTLVAIAYSNQKNIACYPPIQNITPLLKREIGLELQQLSGANKLTRIDGYTELRALSNCIRGLGLPLEFFVLDKSIVCRQLGPSEVRIEENGKIFIFDKKSGQKVAVLPDAFDASQVPLLCSVSDQGGINRASLDYCCFKLKLPLLVLFDPYHRCWNDIKETLKKTPPNLFKTMIAFSLLWNCNYGPAGSKEWHHKKRQKLANLMDLSNANSQHFLAFLPFICAERGLEEPNDAEGKERVFQSMQSLNSIQVLGPLVKLMRWFSWFEAEKFYRGENYCNKLLMMMDEDSPDPTKEVDFVKNEVLMSIEEKGEKISERAELQQLKIQLGTWSLAPLLVTSTSMWQKDLIAIVGAASWLHHFKRAKYVLTPLQVCQHTIAQSQGAWKLELLDMMNDSFYNTLNLKKLYTADSVPDAVKSARLKTHMGFCTKLLGKRASSLCAFTLAPPIRYAALLDPGQYEQVAKKMQDEFQILLGHEAASQEGHHVEGLFALQFLDSHYVRLCYIANEHDLLSGSKEALKILHHALVHLGDTACIESTHSSAKDSLRDARSKFRSRVNKYFHCISSRVLQSRETQHVTISEAELATAKAKDLPSVFEATHPNSHILQRKYQDLMQHKAGDHCWHATTAASQFDQVVALEWLLQSYMPPKNQSPLLSCLAGPPGSVVAARDGEPLLVLAPSSFGFVGWRLEVAAEAGVVGAYPAFRPISLANAICFNHISDLEGWVNVPVQPSTLGHHGGLVLLQISEAQPLCTARVKEGLKLTVKQNRACLKWFNQPVKGQPSKAELYKLLISVILDSPGERDAAFDKSHAGALENEPDAGDADSDYEALLQLVEEDADNRGDPDLVNERKKILKESMPKLLPKGHQTLWSNQGEEERAEEGAGGCLEGEVLMESSNHWEEGGVGEGAKLRQNHCHQ